MARRENQALHIVRITGNFNDRIYGTRVGKRGAKLSVTHYTHCKTGWSWSWHGVLFELGYAKFASSKIKPTSKETDFPLHVLYCVLQRCVAFGSAGLQCTIP
jgi:hypothetical protein